MQSQKNLTIWMDFSIAYLMEYTNNQVITVTIESDGNLLTERHQSLIDKNTLNLPNQEQLSSYYRKISDYIADFEEVTLFGPVGSKNDLFNLLLLNPLFDTINLSIGDAGKMNIPERESFVRTSMIGTGRTLSAFGKRENPHGSLETAGNFTSVVSY